MSQVVAKPIASGATCAPGATASAQAGAYRDLCLSFTFDTSQDDLKGTTIHLPAGVVGDPGATATRCSTDAFRAGGCNATQQVGEVSSDVTATVGATGPPLNLPGVPTPMTVTGEVYNLQPSPTEPARLGISLDQGLAGGMSPVRIVVPISVRVPDAGLDSTTADPVPNTALGGPLHVQSMSLKLWGPKGGRAMAKPFMSLPSRCDVDAVTTVDAVSYGGQVTHGTDKFRPINCNALPFDPTFKASSEAGKDVPFDTPGEASAELILPPAPNDDTKLHQAYLKDVELRLPAGLALNPPIANGLVPCTPEQFAQDKNATPECPANTEMGRVEFRTPIFPGDTLAGKVYFGEPRPGVPLVNYISVEDPRLRLKLMGYATIDPQTTAITAHFEDQPQVPFTSFKFIYTNDHKGKATLTSPVTCGKYDVAAAMTPWGSDSGPAGPTKTPIDFFNVVADDGTMNCPVLPFTPGISAAVKDAQAGADTALTVHIERPDRQQRLQGMRVSLPAGLTGRLPAVPACPVADARAGKCAAASKVGTARVAVGTGPAPLSLPGDVFLTQGYDGGIAGLAVRVDTKLPAIDLGKVTVMNKIVLRPDTGLDVITEPLPQSLEGIPTVYRSIDLTIDRPGFMRNATSCAQQQVRGAFTAVGGAAAAAEGGYQATGCEKLPFNPQLTAKIGAPGETAKRSHPPLSVTITQADGESAMSKTVVTLPEGLGVDIKNLGALCTGEQLDAGQCPAASRIGEVSAETPLLPQKLSGGVYLLKPDKPGLPGIALDLGLTRLRGSVAISTRLTTTFDAVPDVPLRKLVLSLTGGPKGTLSTTTDLCSAAAVPTIDAQYGAHSGAARTAKVAADVTGCTDQAMSKGVRVSGSLSGLKKQQPTVKLKVTSPTALKQVSVKLPKTLKVRSSKALRKSGRLLMGGRKLKGSSVRFSGGKVVVKGPKGKTAKTFSITLPKSALQLRGKLKVGSKATFVVAATPTSGRPVTVRLKLKARR